MPCQWKANKIARETQKAIDDRNLPVTVAKTKQTQNARSFHDKMAVGNMVVGTAVAAATPFAPPAAASYFQLGQQATKDLTQVQGSIGAAQMVSACVSGQVASQHHEMHKRGKSALIDMSDPQFAKDITRLPYNEDGYNTSKKMIGDRVRRRKPPYDE